MSSPDPDFAPKPDPALSEATSDLAVRLAAAVDGGQTVADESLQALMSAAVRLFAAKNVDGAHPRAFAEGGGGVNTTEVMITTTAMLHAVNVQLFELGMWQAWTGAHALYRGERVTQGGNP